MINYFLQHKLIALILLLISFVSVYYFLFYLEGHRVINLDLLWQIHELVKRFIILISVVELILIYLVYFVKFENILISVAFWGFSFILLNFIASIASFFIFIVINKTIL